MRLPRPLRAALAARGVARPTPIQAQALPAALAGRDLLGIASTGSGKTLVFLLPALLWGLRQELRLPLAPGEGPVALVLSPARELAAQTADICASLAAALEAAGAPPLRTALCIGGVPVREQAAQLRAGPHVVVATPGRLVDMLARGRLTLAACKCLALDEADRLLGDAGFEDEVRAVLDHFRGQRQTVLFSATMPRAVQSFATGALVQPLVVNAGRAGAANLDVVQEVEYVKQEAKIVYLLECLQKTAPPVLIFCENKADVDDIHEYLLLKGVAAAATHGGKDQVERGQAIQAFKTGAKDVLVATDVASKGLDFPEVKHVINYDMPKEIENYVHRIGRTGRCGKTGLATTFVNKSQSDQVLLDLKHLLAEAGQRMPPVLELLGDPAAPDPADAGLECGVCGGLGHRIAQCPKFQQQQRQMVPRANQDLLRD